MTSMPRAFVGLSLFAQAIAQAPTPTREPRVVEGRVVDMRGEGVPLARVWLAPRQAPDQVLVRAVADGEGYFRIAKVPDRDDLQTRATADGHCVAIGMMFDTQTVTVTLQHAATVTGVLRSRTGTPMPDTTVVALVNGRSMRAAPCTTRTDAAGRFVLHSVPLAPMQISAWVPGEGMASIAHHVAADCDVEIRPGNAATTSIAIAVEGMPDAALTTLRVALMEQRDGDLVRLPAPLDTLGMATTQLRLELLPDAWYRVSARAPGWQLTPEAVWLEPKGGPHQVKFTATPVDTSTHRCAMEVIDTSGKPVAGANLMVRPARAPGQTLCVSDADGKLTVDTTLAIGSRALVCSNDDRWVTTRRDRDSRDVGDLQARGQYEFVVEPSRVERVQLAAACSVRGRIRRHDGRPAAFVWVELQDQADNREPEWAQAGLTCTDRDGAFVIPRLHARDETLRISVTSPQGAWDSLPFEMKRPGDVIRVPEAILTQPAVIEGVLRDANQRPVPGVRVDLYTCDLEHRGAPLHHVDGTISDRDGRYRFLGVAPVGHRLRVQTDPDDRSAHSIEVPRFGVAPGQVCTHDVEVPAK